MADQESIDELIGRLQKVSEYWRQRWEFQMELGDKQASEVLEQHQEIERLRDEIKNLYASNNRIGGKLRKCREENEHLRAVVQEESDHHKRLAADVALGGDAIYMTGPNIAAYHKERADLLERAPKVDTDG